jgi:hypothetical protein
MPMAYAFDHNSTNLSRLFENKICGPSVSPPSMSTRSSTLQHDTQIADTTIFTAELIVAIEGSQ